MAISPTPSTSAVDELHLDAVDRGADRARLALAVGVVEGGDRRGLAEAVALEHLAAERGLEAPEDLDRQRRAAGGADPQRRRVGRVAVGVVEQRGVHRRDALEDGHGVALDDRERLAGVEARDQRQAGAGGDAGVEPAGLAEGVKQRQRAEDHVVAAPVSCSRSAAASVLRAQVAVRELGALGLAGGARGVEDHRGVVVLARLDRRRRPRRERRAAARTRPARRRCIRRPPRRRRPWPPRRTRARRTRPWPASRTR